MKTKDNAYAWQYVKVGGVTRVRITKGEDIAHLGELDRKLWTALSCPVGGLEFDPVTLSMLDTDSDGKIKVNEVVAAADWLCGIVRDRETLMLGSDTMPLDNFNPDTPDGARLASAARRIIENLKQDKDSICVADTSDSVAIFNGVRFNGDGVVTADTADDEKVAGVIRSAVELAGSVKDRSGVEGVNAEIVEKFFGFCSDYKEWAGNPVLPYGDDSAAVSAAVAALRDKIDDFFMRCSLVAFDASCAGAVDISAEKVGAVSDKNLALCSEEIAVCPLARPNKEGKLDVAAVNPAWKDAFDKFKELVLDSDFKGAGFITEADWNSVKARIAPYDEWIAAKKGAEVESLGLDAVNDILASDVKSVITALIDEDLKYKEASESIDDVNRFMHLYRDFCHFLRNFVAFEDFYSPRARAVFEAGELYIDQRCCHLCVKVADMSKHADMASLSGMFLVYCNCTSKTKDAAMDIAAVITEGNVRDLRPGKNAVFYDRDGVEWNAVVTSVVDNPISVKNAFWSPYRKLAAFINEKIDKSASEKDSKSVSGLVEKADAVQTDAASGTKPAPKPFDIAKFAGIFAAIGMALGYIGTALVQLVTGIKYTPIWQTLLIVLFIMLVISAPACFIAWRKLRKRNLGPVLNANGWAINSSVLVNSVFGATLTSVARYPKLKVADPYARKTPVWKKVLRCIIALLIVAFGVLFFTDNLDKVGINLHPCCNCEPEVTEIQNN